MAEIRVEKKKPVWPWVLLALIILAVVLYFIFAGNNEDDSQDKVDDLNTGTVGDTTFKDRDRVSRDTARWETLRNDTLTGKENEEVDRYLEHVGDQTRMDTDHEYANTALVRLTEAVEAKAQDLRVDLDTQMEEIKQRADEITRDPQATDHAGKIKSTGEKISDALQKLAEESSARLSQEIDEVQTAVQEIDTNMPSLEQREQINTFFQRAADALRKIN